jgi:heme-degrading monooxygenase HmoA
MIARIWHGRVPAAKQDAYDALLRRTGLQDYRATPGNQGVLVLRRTEGDVTHFLLITFWDSVEAIRRFAGEDYTRARYYPEDDNFLLEQEPFVNHYEMWATNFTAPSSASEIERQADASPAFR